MPKVAVRFQKTLNVPTPSYGTDGSAAFDLAVAEDVIVPPGQTVFARTGLVIQAPPNHMLMLAPRSSTWKRYKIDLGNSPAIVDEDYCGPRDELLLCLYNAGQFAQTIERGTRLAQGVFVPITRAVFVEQEEPIAENRGGWGSTGV